MLLCFIIMKYVFLPLVMEWKGKILGNSTPFPSTLNVIFESQMKLSRPIFVVCKSEDDNGRPLLSNSWNATRVSLHCWLHQEWTEFWTVYNPVFTWWGYSIVKLVLYNNAFMLQFHYCIFLIRPKQENWNNNNKMYVHAKNLWKYMSDALLKRITSVFNRRRSVIC